MSIAIFVPTMEGATPFVFLPPVGMPGEVARQIAENEIQQLPLHYQAEDLEIALGRRGFVCPERVVTSVAV